MARLSEVPAPSAHKGGASSADAFTGMLPLPCRVAAGTQNPLRGIVVGKESRMSESLSRPAV